MYSLRLGPGMEESARNFFQSVQNTLFGEGNIWSRMNEIYGIILSINMSKSEHF